MSAPALAFLPLAPEHLGLLHGWLQQPHVRAFWDDGDRTMEQVRAHYLNPDWDALPFVVTLEGRAAGYLQAYPVTPESEYAAWRAEAGETWGLDLLLGDDADIGRGHGPHVIGAFAAFWRAARPDLRRLLIDPEVRNVRAISAYLKAGFVAVGEYPGSAGLQQLLARDFPPM